MMVAHPSQRGATTPSVLSSRKSMPRSAKAADDLVPAQDLVIDAEPPAVVTVDPLSSRSPGVHTTARRIGLTLRLTRGAAPPKCKSDENAARAPSGAAGGYTARRTHPPHAPKRSHCQRPRLKRPSGARDNRPGDGYNRFTARRAADQFPTVANESADLPQATRAHQSSARCSCCRRERALPSLPSQPLR